MQKEEAKKIKAFKSESMPNFFEMDFDVVVNNHAAYVAAETRGIIDAENTLKVAKCAVNRYMQDQLQPQL